MFKKILSSFLISSLIIFNSLQVDAADLSLSASPSKFFNEHVEPNSPKSFIITVADESKGIEDFNPSEIGIKISLVDSHSKEVPNPDKYASCRFISENQVSFDINSTDGLPSGDYVWFVSFSKSINSNSNDCRTVTITVPIQTFIGSNEEFISRVHDYDVKIIPTLVLGDNETSSKSVTTVSKIILDVVLDNLNVSNFISNLDYLKNSDLITKDIDGKYNFDFSKTSFITLDKLNENSKLFDKNYSKETIKTVLRGDDYVQIILDCDGYPSFKIDCSSSARDYIMDQISEISKNNKTISLGDLSKLLYVPINKDVERFVPAINVNIHNRGESPETISGVIKISKAGNVNDESSSQFISQTAYSGKDSNSFVTLQNSISDGDYVVTLESNNNSNNNNSNDNNDNNDYYNDDNDYDDDSQPNENSTEFSVKNVRTKIIVITTLVEVLYIVCLVSLLIFLIWFLAFRYRLPKGVKAYRKLKDVNKMKVNHLTYPFDFILHRGFRKINYSNVVFRIVGNSDSGMLNVDGCKLKECPPSDSVLEITYKVKHKTIRFYLRVN